MTIPDIERIFGYKQGEIVSIKRDGRRRAWFIKLVNEGWRRVSLMVNR